MFLLIIFLVTVRLAALPAGASAGGFWIYRNIMRRIENIHIMLGILLRRFNIIVI